MWGALTTGRPEKCPFPVQLMLFTEQELGTVQTAPLRESVYIRYRDNRNLSVHKEKQEPTQGEADELIRGENSITCLVLGS